MPMGHFFHSSSEALKVLRMRFFSELLSKKIRKLVGGDDNNTQTENLEDGNVDGERSRAGILFSAVKYGAKTVCQKVSDGLLTVPRRVREMCTDDEVDERSSNRGDENRTGCRKELSTLSKILMGVSFAATSVGNSKDMISSRLHYVVLWVAILLMFAGIYLSATLLMSKLSNILQRLGHIVCLVGLMIMQLPVLELPPHFTWLPPFLVGIILVGAMYFAR